jgi:iron-sulfur cluster assembly protein
MLDPIIPVTLSKKAAEEVRKIMKTKNIPSDYGLRVGIRGSGCGGAALMIGFDKKKESDISYQIEDIPVYVDKKHTLYVVGKQVDFYEGADSRGFMFVDSEN